MSEKDFDDLVEHDIMDEEVSAILVDATEFDIKPAYSGVVVSGEASESEEEEINSTNLGSSTGGKSGSRQLKNIRINDFAVGEAIDINPTESKQAPVEHNTLLHRKLRDKNMSLHRNFSELVNRPFNSAIAGISNVTQLLTKTQLAIQELSPLLRQMTNDLFYLEDKVDFFLDYTAALPDIKIQ